MLKSLTNLGILTLITVILWIGFNIYYNLRTSKISEITKIRTEPIESTFDQESLNLLNVRQSISGDLSEQTKIKPESSSPILTPTSSPGPSTPVTNTTPNLLLEISTPTPTVQVEPIP